MIFPIFKGRKFLKPPTRMENTSQEMEISENERPKRRMSLE